MDPHDFVAKSREFVGPNRLNGEGDGWFREWLIAPPEQFDVAELDCFLLFHTAVSCGEWYVTRSGRIVESAF